MMKERRNGKQSDAKQEDAARTRRYVLVTIALLSLALIATQVFLNQTSVGSPRFLRSTFLLWGATVLVVLALLILATVLGRNLIKLYFERKSGQVGSMFKSKMVTTFVALSLLPALLLFFLAYGLINFSIQQWFSAPADQMLEYSRALAAQYYEDARERYQHHASAIASVLSAGNSPGLKPSAVLSRRLEEWRRIYRLDDVRLYDTRARLVASSASPAAQGNAPAGLEELVSRALEGGEAFRVERVSPDDALKEVLRAAVPVRPPGGGVAGVVLVQTLLAQSAYFKAYSVEEAYGVYRQLQRREPALRFNFVLILALSTLLIVFAFSWFAMYLAKRITVPIQALAEGAVAVAAGNLDYRVECAAFDE
ncbi:MAG: hypothetical protein FJW35_14075, partial [Acidobacteria bacterium]|nr:hypothetical protein [Acidobacteriota bacterium]